MAKSQTVKLVNSKAGVAKVLVFNAAFNGTDRRGNSLQSTALRRFTIECHAPINGVMTTLTGNLPVSEIPAMLSLSEQALHDKTIYQQGRQFPLLNGTWKPKVSTKDEAGNTLCYRLDIRYNGEFGMPICITLQNAYTPVVTTDDGRFNVPMSKAVNNAEAKFFVSAEDWYNQLSSAMETYNAYRIAMMTRGVYDESLGIAES